MIVAKEPVVDYSVEALKSIRARRTRSRSPALRLKNEEWQAVAAAGR
jgi:hypothetical protein